MATAANFEIGEQVKVTLTEDILVEFHKNEPRWKPNSIKYIGKGGTIDDVLPGKCVLVDFGDKDEKAIFLETAVCKTTVGDSVNISDNLDMVRNQQQKVGLWKESMKEIIAHTGIIKSFYDNGDLQIRINDEFWRVSINCCNFNDNNCDSFEKEYNIPVENDLHRLVANNDIKSIARILKRSSFQINQMQNGLNPLHIASQNGDYDVVKLLLDSGADIDAQDILKKTPLMLSIYAEKKEITKLLLSKNADDSITDSNGLIPLHIAIIKNMDLEILKLLRKNINFQNEVGETALHIAIFRDANMAVDLLLSCRELKITLQNQEGLNPLHLAVKKNKYSTVKKILKDHFAEIDHKSNNHITAYKRACNDNRETINLYSKLANQIWDNHHLTPLMIAVHIGDLKMVQLLIDCKADLELENDDGDTALSLATLYCQKARFEPNTLEIRSSIAFKLVESKANLYHKNFKKKTPLDNIDNLVLLKNDLVLKATKHSNSIQKCGRHFTVANSVAVLYQAVSGNMLTEVKDLVERMSEENINQMFYSKTALQNAVYSGNRAIVEVLLQAKADPLIKDERGNTALHSAVLGNNPHIIDDLLKDSRILYIVNKNGRSALHVAVQKQFKECVQKLLKTDCINMIDKSGNTPLHEAIKGDNKDIISLLINHSDVSLKDSLGFNIFHLAAFQGNNDAIEKILLKYPDIVDEKKDDGFTGLHLAVLNGYHNVALNIINLGLANLNIKNKDHSTPLMIAIRKGFKELAQILISEGADIDAKDGEGNTCLHMALMTLDKMFGPQGNYDDITSSCTDMDIVKMLILKGAKYSEINNNGKTAIESISNEILKNRFRNFIEDLTKQKAISQPRRSTGQLDLPVCYLCMRKISFNRNIDLLKKRRDDHQKPK